MYSRTLLAFVALAVTTIAAPHAHGHHHLHARAFELAPLAGRELSNNGACGGAQGLTCGAGYCCSEWGYCGNTASYCDAGCQSAFGTCNTTSDAITSAAIKTAVFTRPAHSYSGGWTASTSIHSTATVSSPAASSIAPIPSASDGPSSSTAPVASETVTQSSPEETQTSTAQSTTFATSVATTTAVATTTYIPATSSSSAPAPTSTSSSGGSGSDSYTVYSGDGSVAAGWPSQDSWSNFDSMWTSNMAYISISCTQFGEANNSDQESDDLKSSIQAVASSSGVDARFILAVVMQESKGCVRAPTTNYGVNNPGLMQSHDGSGSCNIGGTIQNPCPSSEITQMIKDGSTGTAAGDGLSQLISQTAASDVSKFYKASRMYNSGSIASSGNLQDGIATHCYSSDIANRLTGWVQATTKCTFD